VESGHDASVCLLNYRSDGTPFWNQFFVAALRDEKNEIVNYVGVQCPIQPADNMEKLEQKVRMDEGGGLERSDSSISPTTISNNLPFVASLLTAARSSQVNEVLPLVNKNGDSV